MANCCPPDHEDHSKHEHAAGEHAQHEHGGAQKFKIDWLLLISAILIVAGYALHLFALPSFLDFAQVQTFSATAFGLVNQTWWSLLLGMFFVGLLDQVPREFIMTILGRKTGFSGVLRAAGAGVLLDLCSHGILFVGMKLYERGASLGQVMAFLIASPWNSFSLTLLLWALIGFQWMLAILLLSFAIALISGVIFDWLVARGTLPENPNRHEIAADFHFWPEAKKQFGAFRFSADFIARFARSSISGSVMVLRWILFGFVLSGLVRAFLSPEMFSTYFGPTVLGLGLTVLVATVLEICSEGSTPLAADLLTRAGAPGNAFAFLMAGVATDYTEVILLKQTTKSWKIAFALPLITLPQVILVAWILNQIT
jgi:hypothetical protein